MALGVFAALDIATSLWGLTHGYLEAAPAMAAVITALGIWAIAPLKVALSVVVVALVSRVETKPRAVLMAVALAIFAAPAISNLTMLIQDALRVVE